MVTVNMGSKTRQNLAPAIRASLNAKRARLLARPLIAQVQRASPSVDADQTVEGPDVFRALQNAARDLRPTALDAWREDPDNGTCRVQICIDYDDRWRGCEKEVLETIKSTIESNVAFLTEEQKSLLERSPAEFLALSPRPQVTELVAFATDDIAGSTRVVELTFAAPPESPEHVRYVAIVPNLVQLERQLDALHTVETAEGDGPLGPLRALIGASDDVALGGDSTGGALTDRASCKQLDEFQLECVHKALATPHFAVIEGPPGSGKTTVITTIVRDALASAGRVLIVSPTHVAVDNVVEKLVSVQGTSNDLLAPHGLPLRYAARVTKLSDKAAEYWVGARKQSRGATIARRVEVRLRDAIPFARSLFEQVDPDAARQPRCRTCSPWSAARPLAFCRTTSSKTPSPAALTSW